MAASPIVLCALQVELRTDRTTREALESKGLAPVSSEEGEALREALHLAGFVEVGTGADPDVLLERAAQSLWERDAKLGARRLAEKEKGKGRKGRKEIVLQKDPEIERQILALGAQLEEKKITFDEWNSRFQALIEAQTMDMENKGACIRLLVVSLFVCVCVHREGEEAVRKVRRGRQRLHRPRRVPRTHAQDEQGTVERRGTRQGSA